MSDAVGVVQGQDSAPSPLSPTPLSIEPEQALSGYKYTPKEKVLAFTGPRGSGKSLCMAWFIIRWMQTTGLPVYSNMKVKFQGLESLPLDMIDFATQSLSKCLVCIDELQYWADRQSWGSTRSKILSYVMMQIRKEEMSFMFTIQDINWLNKRMGFQVDTLCECTDEYFRNQYNRKLGGRIRKPGQFISMTVKDISGSSTGLAYYKSGMFQIRRMGPCDLFWNSYDSGETQDISEAFTKYEMKGRKVVLSVEDPGDASMVDPYTYEDHRPNVEGTIRDIVTGYRGTGRDDVTAKELQSACELAGLKLSPSRLGRHLVNMGVVNHRSGTRGTFYDIKGIY